MIDVAPDSRAQHHPQALKPIGQRDLVLIGLVGAAGAGKSAVGERLVARYGFVQAAFADPLKDALASWLDELGVDYAVLHEPGLKELPLAELAELADGISARRLMQAFGDAGRGISTRWWTHLAGARLGLLPGGTPVHDRIVLTDVRYPEEEALVRSAGGVVVRVLKADQPRLPGDMGLHSSEQHWPHLIADHELRNGYDTLRGLLGAVDDLMDRLGIDPRGSLE